MEEEIARQYREQAKKIEADLARLKLYAPRSGVVIRPPEPEELGKFFKVGNVFCVVGDPKQLEARLVIDQGDMDLVRVGQKATLRFYSHPLDSRQGTIAKLAESDAEAIPEELSTAAGGEVPTKPDPTTGRQVPIETLYYAVVPLENRDGLLKPGMRGSARIKARSLTLARRVWRWFNRTFRFKV